MDTTLWILVYSKFSPYCRKLLSIIDTSNIPINFKMLDIDNSKIRKLIKNNKTIDIKYVPCIVSINSLGEASKYEAGKAFELIYQLIPPEPKQEYKPIPKPQHANAVFRPKYEPPTSLPEPIAPVVLPTTTSIDTLLEFDQDETINEEIVEQNTPVVEQKQKSGKINISSVLTNAQVQEPPPNRPSAQGNIVPVQTGKKVSASEIMASRQ